jgi:prepilin-type N-terminal cleavage/methylation domain-containing protein
MNKKGFVLTELLVVVSILAVLATAVASFLNPGETLSQGSDAQRIADIETLNTAISIYNLKVRGFRGEENEVYISLPDIAENCSTHLSVLPALSSGWYYHCVTEANLMKIDGTGWLPINLNAMPGGSIMFRLPVDPVNNASAGEFYSYAVSADGYELAATIVSEKFSNEAQTDNGKSDVMYELGTDTNIVAEWLAALAPAGLASLDLSVGDLEPLFTTDNLLYTADAPYDSNSIIITSTASKADSIIRVNGIQVMSGQPSPNVYLVPGGITPINISVTSSGGEVQYTVNVTRASSPYLSGLTVNYGRGLTAMLSPSFAYNTLQYTTSTAGTLTFTITSTAAAGGTILLNGVGVSSGVPISKTVVSFPAVFTIHVSSLVGIDSRDYVLTITN